jgi:hypothetical protein
MRAGNLTQTIFFFFLFFLFSVQTHALSTQELTYLKKSGVAEEIILFMVESDYKDVDRVIKLKSAGFKDETIMSIIRHDVKNGRPAKPQAGTPEKTRAMDIPRIETTGKVRILWYMVYRGQAVLQNSDEVIDAKMFIVGKRLTIEWPEKNLGLLDAFSKRPFQSPFFWDIDDDDTTGGEREGYPFILQSSTNHKGKPDTDGSHYWAIYLSPADTKIIDYIRERILKN